MERLIVGGDANIEWEESFRKIPLAKVQSLFQAQRHPQSATLLEEGKVWAETRIAPVLSQAAMQKLRADNGAALACYLYPNADPTRALTLVKFAYWIIIFDDVTDDPQLMGSDVERLRRYGSHFLRAMFEGGDAHADGFSEGELLPVHVGLEWWGEMKRQMTPTLQARLAEAMRAYVMVQLRCAQWRSEWAVWLASDAGGRGAPPCSLEELVPVWRVASGAGVTLVLIEYDLGIELEAESLAHPVLQQLIESGADHLIWINCMFSFPKDVEKDDALNLLTCLHLRTGSLPATLTQAWDTFTAIERDCAGLATHLAQQSAPVKQYADALCAFLTSHWAWSVDCGRYPHTQ